MITVVDSMTYCFSLESLLHTVKKQFYLLRSLEYLNKTGWKWGNHCSVELLTPYRRVL